jgi:hypothetical protein
MMPDDKAAPGILTGTSVEAFDDFLQLQQLQAVNCRSAALICPWEFPAPAAHAEVHDNTPLHDVCHCDRPWIGWLVVVELHVYC